MKFIIPKILFFNFIACFSNLTFGQIENELHSISKAMSFQNDTTFSDYHASKTMEYEFLLENKILGIKTKSKDSYKSMEFEKILNRKYNIPLTAIESMELSTLKIPYMKDSEEQIKLIQHLNFKALRSQTLFEEVNEGDTSKISVVSIPIHKAKDTVYVDSLLTLLNNEHDISENSIAASCEYSDTQFEMDGPIIKVIRNKDLDKPITLNGNQNINEEIGKVLSEVMSKNNMKTIGMEIAINPKNQIEGMAIMEYLAASEFKDQLAVLNEEEKVQMQETFGFISKSTNDEIIALLKNQTWKAGECNGELVLSGLSIELSSNK